MSKRLSRKQLKHNEIEEAAVEAGHWIGDNLRAVIISSIAILVIASVVGGGWWLRIRQVAEDRRALSVAVKDYNELEGTGFSDGDALAEVSSRFESLSGSSAPGRLASYYHAVALIAADHGADAIPVLEAFTTAQAADDTLAAAAIRMLGEQLLLAGREDEAVTLLEAQVSSAGALNPELALLELARIARADGDMEASRGYLERIQNDYADSAASLEARRLLLGS